MFNFKPLLWIASWISIQIKLNFITIYRIHSKNHKMPAVVSDVLAKIHLSLKKERGAFSSHMTIVNTVNTTFLIWVKFCVTLQ